MNDLDQLGRRLAQHQDRRLVERERSGTPPSPAMGEHLLRRAGERRRRRQLTTVSVVALLLAGGTVAGLRLRSGHEAGQLAAVRAQAGQRVTASLLDVAVAFDDGSRVVLSSGASLRTEMIGPASATLDLERGRALVRVMHTQHTHWTVRAGSYTVAVTGTRFRLGWRPEKGAFSITVEEGSVRVSGGLLTEAIDITAGQSLAIEHGRPLATTAGVPVPEVAAPAPAVAAPAAPLPPAPTLLPPPSEMAPPLPAHRSIPHHAAALSWRDQAEAGRYRDAMAEAERKGFETICREAGGADLLTLAEAARYAGRSERAEQALKAVRARFGRTEDAAVAAYVLGRIAAENRHDYPEAARWFRTYLGERPSGTLEREAEGRLLESLAFMDRTTAREAARAYLQHHPAGPHAAFARNLLGQ
jgi:transmembrane sensor